MPIRNDLTYERRETKAPYILTGAADVDEALENALDAVYDAKTFRAYARATGVDVVRKDISWGMAAGCFACGVVACLLVLWLTGVI